MTMEKNMQKTDANANEATEDRKDCPLVFVENGRMFTTSLRVAEAFEKEHKDVLKAISNLECSKEFHKRNFAPMIYTAEIGKGAKREFPAYTLTRDGFIFLSMEFTDTKVITWKEKFLAAFNAMEAHLPERQTDYGYSVNFFPCPDSRFGYSPRKACAKAQCAQPAELFAVAHCGRKDH